MVLILLKGGPVLGNRNSDPTVKRSRSGYCHRPINIVNRGQNRVLVRQNAIRKEGPVPPNRPRKSEDEKRGCSFTETANLHTKSEDKMRMHP
jgi:hypothetical protein